MVVKTSIEDCKVEDETKKEHDHDHDHDEKKKDAQLIDTKADAAPADGEEQAKDVPKVVTKKFIRTYAAHWKKKVNPKLRLYETSFEIKKNAADADA